MNCSPHTTWHLMFLPWPVMKRTGRQGQQNLSFASMNQSLSRWQLHTFPQYFSGPTTYCLQCHLPCSKFYCCKTSTFPASKSPCWLNTRFWSGPIYSRVAPAASAKHLVATGLLSKRPGPTLLVRSQVSNLGGIQHLNTTTSAFPASSQRIRGEQERQHFSQQHKHCTTVRGITDHKFTPKK